MKLSRAFTLLSAFIPPILGQKFTNPVLWEDLADMEIIRVNNTYYYTASTMHYSPGAPILRSFDLVNWEYIGHSVPALDFSPKYDLANGERGYVRGIWASTLQYRESNQLFYWIGCIDFSQTYVYTSPSPTGPWTKRSQIGNCYYDAGLLVDDDDIMYVAYGANTISVAQLSSDGLSQVKAQEVYTSPPEISTVEGSRFYKIDGKYYIFVTHPESDTHNYAAQYILKSDTPWGPYTIKEISRDIPTPVPGGGHPRQGGLIQTQKGDWYYMAFIDDYPGGRIPVLAPITWGSDGFPSISTVDGGWSKSYQYPLPKRPVTPSVGTDRFLGKSLRPEWEWNHNPDTTKFIVNNGLTLQTATLTNDLYSARNTLTRRITGPTSTATILLNYKNMKPDDHAGLVMLRDYSAWIGVKNENGTLRVAMVSGLVMDSNDNWKTLSTGHEEESATLFSKDSRIWLRVAADITPGSGRVAKFSYSADGKKFIPLGKPYILNNTWNFFMGYRYGIFNYATKVLGGSVHISLFTTVVGVE